MSGPSNWEDFGSERPSVKVEASTDGFQSFFPKFAVPGAVPITASSATAASNNSDRNEPQSDSNATDQPPAWCTSMVPASSQPMLTNPFAGKNPFATMFKSVNTPQPMPETTASSQDPHSTHSSFQSHEPAQTSSHVRRPPPPPPSPQPVYNAPPVSPPAVPASSSTASPSLRNPFYTGDVTRPETLPSNSSNPFASGTSARSPEVIVTRSFDPLAESNPSHTIHTYDHTYQTTATTPGTQSQDTASFFPKFAFPAAIASFTTDASTANDDNSGSTAPHQGVTTAVFSPQQPPSDAVATPSTAPFSQNADIHILQSNPYTSLSQPAAPPSYQPAPVPSSHILPNTNFFPAPVIPFTHLAASPQVPARALPPRRPPPPPPPKSFYFDQLVEQQLPTHTPPPTYNEACPPPPTYDEACPPPPSYDEACPPPPTYNEACPPPPTYNEACPPPPSYDEACGIDNMPTQQLLLTPYNIQHGSLASYDNSRDDSFTVADAASATNTAATFAVSSGNHASATASAIKSSLFLTSLPTYQSLMAGGGGVAGYQEAGDGAAATAPDLLASPLPSFACVTEDGTYQGISSTTAGFTTMTSSAPDSAAPSSSANSSMLSHLLDHSPHVTQHYAAAAAQRSAASGPYPVIVGTMRGGSAEGISSPASSPYALGLPSGFNDIGYDEVRERLCVEVRLPPLKPKVAVQPRLLVSGCKSLFLAPASAGGTMLQWTTASSGELQIPLGLSRAVFEDFDSAPSGVVVMPTTELTYLTTASGASGPGATAAAVPEQVSADAVTCTLMDEVAGTLWTGHSSGRMCRWLVEKGVGAVWKQQWVGSRTGSILALTSTAWGDLWTASMAGSIRVWNYPDGIAGNRPPTQILEVKRPLGGKPHGRKVVGMAASSSGGTVWTAGRSSILIWNAYTMQCLGALRSPFTGTGEGSIAPSIMDGDVPWISTITGVDASLLKRPVEGRRLQPGSADPEFDTDPRAVIGIQVLKGVKGVGKFAAKLGKKIQNIAASAEATARQGGVLPPSQTASDTRYHHSEEKSSAAVICGLVATPHEPCMVVAYKNGLVEKYSEMGKHLWSENTKQCIICCIAVVGMTLWLGGQDGHIRVLTCDKGELLREWHAHLFPVISLAAIGGTVYSLAEDGAVRGWPVAAPSPSTVTAWQEAVREGLRLHQLRLLAGTWNVNESRPSALSIRQWLGAKSKAADVVCVGLQEVEMGTGSVAMDAAKNILNKGSLEKGNVNAHWWASELLSALGANEFVKVGLRQMSGILVMVFCRNELLNFVGEVLTASVPCGVLGVGGNKGAVAVSMSLFRRRFLFIASHFAAHQDKVEERNENYLKIVRYLRFSNTSNAAAQVSEEATSSTVASGSHEEMRMIEEEASYELSADMTSDMTSRLSIDSGQAAAAGGNTSTNRDSVSGGGTTSSNVSHQHASHVPPVPGPGLRDTECVIWMGDFNYRINQGYERVVDLASAGQWSELLQDDQLRLEAARGAIFRTLYEVPPMFPPTYKFDKGVPSGPAGSRLPYDSSEKRRVPAWTDRILWRGGASSPAVSSSREEDVVALPVGNSSDQAYQACMEVCESDHKPVTLELELTIPSYIQDIKRKHSIRMLTAISADSAAASSTGNYRVSRGDASGNSTLETAISRDHSSGISHESAPAAISLQFEGVDPSQVMRVRVSPVLDLAPGGAAQPPLVLPLLRLDREGHIRPVLIKNMNSQSMVVYAAGCKDRVHYPSWLEVVPASLVIGAGQTKRVILRAVAPDLMYAQQFPLETTVQFVCQALLETGTGALCSFGKYLCGGATAFCVEVN